MSQTPKTADYLQIRSNRLGFKTIILITLIIALWQGLFFFTRNQQNSPFHVDGTVGLVDSVYRKYLYFFYYLGWMPATVLIAQPKEYSVEGALRFAKENAENLGMDAGYTSGKLGDYGKIFLYYPELWLRGPKDASIRSSLFLLQVFTLTFLFIRLWSIGWKSMAFSLTLFIGSCPFQLFHLYLLPNVYPIPILTAVFLLALNLKLLARPDPFKIASLWLPIVSGIWLALSKQIRPEPFAMIIGVTFAYLFVRGYSLLQRFALITVLLISTLVTKHSSETYFEKKYSATTEMIEQLGGKPYYGFRSKYHVAWHSVHLGLGDFDKKYGIYTKDQSSYEYALPILKRLYYPAISWEPTSYFLNQYYDSAKRYPISPEDLPEYEIVLRNRVLSLIFNDPLWYIEIISKRLRRIFSEATPVSLKVASYGLEFSHSGWIFLGILGILLVARQYSFLKLIIFTMPLVLIPLFVYSENGYTGYSIHHIVAFAALVQLLSKKLSFHSQDNIDFLPKVSQKAK